MTELLEGETLRGKLDGSTVTQRQAVDWALQIAKGLSAAHGKGVVHRDLKPDNVFVTNDGHVKILDFGLAKRVDAAPAEQTSAPTGTGGGHTEPGTVMGTMGYMSPEQVRGLPVDHRTDLFSFGAILYELLSGRKAFKRDTASDTMAAIMRDEPPELTQSGRNVSPALDHIVRHCLEKDRENRFQTAKDVAFALSEASAPTTAVTSGVVRRRAPPRRAARQGDLVVAALVAVLAVAALLLWRRPAARIVRRLREARRPPRRRPPVREPGRRRGRLLRRRHRRRDPRQADVAAGPRGHRARQLDALQEDDQDAAGDRAGARRADYLLTATVRWQKRRRRGNRVQVSPELVEIKRDGAPASKWQQPFDAALTDVFQVQSDIATEGGAGAGRRARRRARRSGSSEKPTQNLAAYDAFLKGEEVSNALDARDPPACARDSPSTSRRWRSIPASSQAWARGLDRQFAARMPTASDPRARGARAAGCGEGRSRSRRIVPTDTSRSGRTSGWLPGITPRALEQYARRLRLAPGEPGCSGHRRMPSRASDTGIERWNISGRRRASIPRSACNLRALGNALLRLRRYRRGARGVRPRSRARAVDAESHRVAGDDVPRRGGPAGARAVAEGARRRVEPTALVAYLANYSGPGLGPRRGAAGAPAAADPERVRRRPGRMGTRARAGDALKGTRRTRAPMPSEAAKAFEEQLKSAPEMRGFTPISASHSRISAARRKRSGRGSGRSRSARSRRTPSTVPTTSTSSRGSTS